MVSKSEKEQGITIVNKKDCQLFSDLTKFGILNKDPTLPNLSTIQIYLNTLELRGEMTKDENKQMRSKFVKIGRAQGLPKIHKQFVKVLSLLPIFGTTNTLITELENF